MNSFFTIRWHAGAVEIIDQRALPAKEVYLKLHTVEDLAQAIKTLAIRGAPALGVAGAMGIALSAQTSTAADLDSLKKDIERDADFLAVTRPTAVNLRWGIDQLLPSVRSHAGSTEQLKEKLITAASKILEDDIRINRTMGEWGAALIANGDTVLTHCNAGALATGGFGTALGVIYAANHQGKKIRVIADETRPVLQGARLTAWELTKNGIDVTLIADNMAASLMARGLIQKIIVGADRIAMNGDVANKIGTYSVAIAAHHHKIPFYVAAPLSTIDPDCAHGKEIPIEDRHAEEVTHHGGTLMSPADIKVYNPAFDVTPHELVSAIITEKGVVLNPTPDKMKELYGDKS